MCDCGICKHLSKGIVTVRVTEIKNKTWRLRELDNLVSYETQLAELASSREKDFVRAVEDFAAMVGDSPENVRSWEKLEIPEGQEWYGA